MKPIVIAIIATLLLCLVLIKIAKGEEIPKWKILLGEAANQGETGMRAVACVIRNRGSIRGFASASRKDLDAFCERQGPHWIRVAKRIAQEIFKDNAPDITNGATHFENVQAFGLPYWAKEMKETCKIGSHTFWRNK